MNSAVLNTIAATGFTVAFFHAAIPTHWLPFVMASRSQKWSWSKTQSILLISGFGHVIMTTLLGALLLFGFAPGLLTTRIEPAVQAVIKAALVRTAAPGSPNPAAVVANH